MKNPFVAGAEFDAPRGSFLHWGTQEDFVSQLKDLECDIKISSTRSGVKNKSSLTS